MAFLSIPILHPSPAALSRSAILHDMSEASFEQSTPVMVLSPARKESGKKSVKQRPRRKRRAALRYERTEEQVKGRSKDFHLQIPSHRWSETDTDSSDSSSTNESHWIQAKRRAQVKFRLSRRRRNKKPSGILDESSAPNEIHPVHLGSRDKKHPELTECESYSSNLRRGKGPTYQGCSVCLPRRSSDIKRPSRKDEESRGRYHHRDPRLLHSPGQNETIKRMFSETGSSTEMLAVKEGGKPVEDAGFLQKPPATYHDGSDHLKACRSVTPEKDLITSNYISSCCELRVCVCHLPSKHNLYSYCCLSNWIQGDKTSKGLGRTMHKYPWVWMLFQNTVRFPSPFFQLNNDLSWSKNWQTNWVLSLLSVRQGLWRKHEWERETLDSSVQIWWTVSTLTEDIQGLGGLRSDFCIRKISSAVGANLFSSYLTRQDNSRLKGHRNKSRTCLRGCWGLRGRRPY